MIKKQEKLRYKKILYLSQLQNIMLVVNKVNIQSFLK